MRKKLPLFLVSMIATLTMYANSGIIKMQWNGEHNHPKGPHKEAPTVTYEYDMLTIKADTTYNNARVIVKSVNGDIQYTNVINITQQPQTLYMPGNDKHSIEIYCDKNMFYGTFEDE